MQSAEKKSYPYILQHFVKFVNVYDIYNHVILILTNEFVKYDKIGIEFCRSYGIIVI